jgi:hypothetical protein
MKNCRTELRMLRDAELFGALEWSMDRFLNSERSFAD